MQKENSTHLSADYLLNNGVKMPRIGLGTFLATGLEDLVYDAVKYGYRHIDTARKYGNEKEIGAGLKKVFENGAAQRSELFIVTRVWPDRLYDPEASLRESLADLGLDYVDLFLIHWPVGIFDPSIGRVTQPALHVTWSKMEECIEKGLCRNIGVSNFNVQILLDLLSYARYKPACNQVELHPYLSQPDLVRFCLKNNIAPIAYSPLCGASLEAFGEPFEKKRDIFNEKLLSSISEKYHKTVAQIVLNWHLSRGHTIVPKSSHTERIKENFDVFDFEMSDADIELINDLNCNYRMIDPRQITIFDFNPLFD